MTRQIARAVAIGSLVVLAPLGALAADEPSAKPPAKPAASRQHAAAQQTDAREASPAEPTSGAKNVSGVATKSKQQKAADAVIEFVQPKFTLPLMQGYSKVIRTKEPIIRVAVASPEIVDVVPFKRNEVGVMGKSPGVTTVTIWVGTKEKSEPMQMLVRVERNIARRNRAR